MKRIRKLIPVDYYDIPAMQSYLGDMAAQGLLLHSRRAHFASYDTVEPQTIRYHLEPFGKKETMHLEEKKECYKDFGWDYVTTYHPFHIFSTTQEMPQEIYTDPVAQRESYEPLRKAAKKTVIASLFYTAFLCLIGIFAIFYGAMYLNGIAQYVVLSYPSMALVPIACALYSSGSSYYKVKKLTKAADAGLSVPHKKNYRKFYIRHIAYVVQWLYCIVLVVTLLCMGTGSWGIQYNGALEDYPAPLPVIFLSQIEGDETITYPHSRSRTLLHQQNIAVFDNYVVKESGEIPGRTWEGEKDVYDPSLFSQCMRLRGSEMVEDMFDLHITDALDTEEEPMLLYNELYDTPFDRAVVIGTERTQTLVASADNTVISIDYRGEEDLLLHMQAIYDAMADFR